MKVFPHGQGAGEGLTRYLVRPDYPGRDEHPPEVLRGDPDRFPGYQMEVHRWGALLAS